MIIEILINGLAICYQVKDEDYWQIVFLCNAEHPVNFSDEDPVNYRPLFKGQDGFISFNADGAITSKFGTGDGFDQIFNIASNKYGHGDNTLAVHRTGSWKTISMIIPSAILSMAKPTEKNYIVCDYPVRSSGNNIGPVAKIIRAEFELAARSELSMIINDGTGKSKIITYTDDVTLTFDNDCHITEKLENDFLHYYDWLEDTVNIGRKFIAGKQMQGTQAAGGNKSVFDSDQGNCDPIVVHPPPND